MTVVRGKEAGEAAAMAAKLEPPQIVEGRRGCRHRLCGAFNRVENSKSRKIRVTLAVAWHKNYTGCAVRSVAWFCHFLSYMFLLHAWAAWQLKYQPPASGTLSKTFKKTARLTGRRTLYCVAPTACESSLSVCKCL